MGRLSVSTRLRRLLSSFIALCACLAGTTVVSGSANAASGCGMVAYSCDVAGRPARVSGQTNHVASYSYDPAGSITGAVNRGRPDLWVQSMAPLSGPAGTISGGCFSSNAGDDEARFGGVPATMTHASPVHLVAEAPPGAVDGPVTVLIESGGNRATQYIYGIVNR